MKKTGMIVGAVIVAGALGAGAYLLISALLGSGVKDFHEDALETLVPEDAVVVVSFDMEWFLNGAINENFGLMDASDPDELREDLSKASKKYMGFDILQAEKAVWWVTKKEERFALVLTGDFDGEPEGERTKEHNGTDMVRFPSGAWSAKLGDDIVIGSKRGVQHAIDLAEGDIDPLSANADALEAHKEALDAIDDGPVVVSASFEAFERELPRKYRKLRAVGMSAASSGKLTMALVGDEDTLADLMDLYDDGWQEMEDQLDKMLRDAKDEGAGEVVLALTFARHKLDDVRAMSELEVDGEVMTMESEMESSALFAYAAVAAVVAVPAFIKYMRRAKTTEAIDQLDKMYKSASNYYTAPRVAKGTGEKLECQFPETQGMTPDVNGLSCCGGRFDADNDDRCDVDTTQWTTATWSALNFQMNDQHYFGYAFTSEGTGEYAKFTASAHADLDCDGTLSTFERYGYGDTGYGAECSMKGRSAFYKNNETE